jgi:hypothetical protein
VRRKKLLILLPLAAVAVGFQNYVFFSGLSSGPGPVDEELEEQITLEDGDEARAPTPVDPLLLAEWLGAQPSMPRSPFLTRAEAEELGEFNAFALPALTATLWSPLRRVAWMNGRPLSEGDLVAGHALERIEPRQVVLRRGDVVVRVPIGRPADSAAEGLDVDED